MIKINAVGRLSEDAKVETYGREGKTCVKFKLVCNHGYNDDQPPTTLFCTKFASDENLAQYMKQGDQFIISGSFSKYRGIDGNYYDQVILDRDGLEFGAKKKEVY